MKDALVECVEAKQPRRPLCGLIDPLQKVQPGIGLKKLTDNQPIRSFLFALHGKVKMRSVHEL
jgi:hypothetical protein